MRLKYFILPALLLLLLFPYLFLTSGYKNFKYKYQVNFSIPDSDKYIHPLFVRLTLTDENIVKALYREDCNNVGSDNAYVYVEECSPTQVTIDFVYANSWSSTDTYPKPATVNFYFGGDQDKQYPPDFFKVFSHSLQYRTISVPANSCSPLRAAGPLIGSNITVEGTSYPFSYTHYLYIHESNSYCSNPSTDVSHAPWDFYHFNFDDNCYVQVLTVDEGTSLSTYSNTTTCSSVSPKNSLNGEKVIYAYPLRSPFDGYGYALTHKSGISPNRIAILYIFKSCSSSPDVQHIFDSTETNDGVVESGAPVPGGYVVIDDSPAHAWKIDPNGNVVFSVDLPSQITGVLRYCLFDGDLYLCDDADCVSSSTGAYSTIPDYAYCQDSTRIVGVQGSYYLFRPYGSDYVDVVNSNGEVVERLGLHAGYVSSSGELALSSTWQPYYGALIAYDGSVAKIVSTECYNAGMLWFAGVTATQTAPVYLSGDLNDDSFESYDSSPPTVSIVSPADGSTVYSPFTVTLDVNDDGAWSYCEVYLDSTLYATETDETFSLSVEDGNYSMYVKCYDFAGNSSTSSTIHITVFQAPSSGGGPENEDLEEQSSTPIQQQETSSSTASGSLPLWYLLPAILLFLLILLIYRKKKRS